MRTPTLGLFLLMLVGFPAYTYAQTPSNAGSLQQQIEKERKSTLPPAYKIPSLEGKPVTKESPAEAKLQITVKSFRFEGNKLLSDKELSGAVSSYLNRPISFNELKNAASAVGDVYRAKGFVVKSFLPKQGVVDGIITIKIIEAKFGQTKIEGDTGILFNQSRVDKMVSIQQSRGAPINTQKLDRSLLLIDDLPGVSASGRLQEGEEASETDLILSQKKEAFASGSAIMDNQGSRSTGDERLHAFLQLMNPMGLGDQSSVYILGAQGVGFARLEQSFPVGYNGLRIGANASAMRYNLVAREFKTLDGEGQSGSMGLQANYPIIRAREHNLYINGNYDHKYFDNDVQGVTSSNYQINNYTVSLSGNIIDKIFGGGNSNANIGMTFGSLDLNSLNTGESAELDGNFRKIFYNISRQQALKSTVSFYAAFSGQISPSRRLDSAEMFYLGGPTGVRAYPVSEGSGVSGNMLNTELRWNFAPSYQLTGFYDHGYVHNNGNVKSYSLDGAGVALGWQSKSGFTVDASWAHRIGDNPNRTATGNDQDGSSIENRFWLKISKRF